MGVMGELGYKLQYMKSFLQKIIHYATKAPSCRHNQPWKFRTEGSSLYIYPDYSRNHREADGDDHELFIALGCALENVVVAANAFGYREMITYKFSDEQDCVYVSFEPSDTRGRQDLFLAIEERKTLGSSHNGQYIPAEQLADLALQARERDVFLKIYDSEEEYARLLPRVEEAVMLQFHDKDFPGWVRFNNAEGVGDWGEPTGTAAVPGWMGRLYTDHIALAKAEARKARELMQNSAALILFATVNHTKQGWVNLGRSYERVLLRATALGISHAPLNMPCEVEAIREKLKKDIECESEEPLLLIRFGYTGTVVKREPQTMDEVIESLRQ